MTHKKRIFSHVLSSFQESADICQFEGILQKWQEKDGLSGG
jgi:hypothetical protein